MSKSESDGVFLDPVKILLGILKFVGKVALALLRTIIRVIKKGGAPPQPDRNAPGFDLKDALARAFCAVIQYKAPIERGHLEPIGKALSMLSAYSGTPDKERDSILYHAFLRVQKEGINGANGACEIIGRTHGVQMLHVMNQFIRWIGIGLPMKEHLMWHLNTEVGVSVDDYTKMWEADMRAPPISFD